MTDKKIVDDYYSQVKKSSDWDTKNQNKPKTKVIAKKVIKKVIKKVVKKTEVKQNTSDSFGDKKKYIEKKWPIIDAKTKKKPLVQKITVIKKVDKEEKKTIKVTKKSTINNRNNNKNDNSKNDNSKKEIKRNFWKDKVKW
jgi:hypothetical protein